MEIEEAAVTTAAMEAKRRWFPSPPSRFPSPILEQQRVEVSKPRGHSFGEVW
ncbi:hypothetical protein Lalb_Chr17g0337071 [Lupinus albus]|uniref:Uncharacterized protein n=1 Tax=Lupinus albus TaxID=3870 RepID=A0A6A4P4U2_LUPAL|nr:hypothetical protein Lalb_Chr17g0337071 [Lupinus albus]